MDQQREWKRDLRGVSVLVAVVIALMGFSAALATREEAGATPAAEPELAAYRDPSLAGLSVADDAEADGTVDMQY
jgi:hypothetical protein